jgi:simple sugar transport system permease protein
VNGAGRLARVARGLLAPALAAAVAIVVSCLALWFSGNSIPDAFSAMWRSIRSVESVVSIINGATPYYVAGVAVAIGFKMNLFNIGANGQYRLAALLAGAAGAAVDLPAPIHVAFIFLIAIAVGGFWAAIAGILKVTRGVNEVISTIMLNYIAVGISAFLLSEYLRNPDKQVAETNLLPKSARLPSLDPLLELVGIDPGRFPLEGFLPFAILIGIGYYVLLFRSRFGYELRVSGMNPAAASSAGVKPKAMVLKTIILSGCVAGLIGMSDLMADPQFYKFGDQFPLQLGFTGIAIALLGRNHPAGIAAAAIVWATIDRATRPLSSLGIPQEVGVIMQGSFLLAAVIVYEVVRRRNEARTARDAAARAAAARTEPPGGPPGPVATAVGATR